MKKLLRLFSLMVALCAIFQTQVVKADNYAAILPGNSSTTSNTSSYIRIDGAKIKTKITSLPFTVEMAFKPTAFNAYGGLWSDRSSGSATTIQYNNTTNSIRVDYAGTSTVLLPASAVTVLNAWNHVALVVTSTSIKLVLNGVTYQRTGMTNTAIPFSGRSYIGQDSASTSTLNRTVTGQFDEIRFWNTARTDAQLAANKFKPLVGNEVGLVAYYNFDSSNPTDGTANVFNAVVPASMTYKDLTTDASMISSADLTGINFSSGVLGADFAAATTTYTAYVPPTSTNTVDVTGNPSAYLPPVTQTADLTLASPNTVLTVTSMDGTTPKTYNVNITQTDLSTYWSGNGIATGSARSYPNLWGWKCSNTDNCWSLANSSGTAIRYNDVLATANTWWATTPTTAWGGRMLYLRWDGSGNTAVNSVFSYPVSVVAGKAYTFTYKYSWANNGTQPVFTYGFGTDQAGLSIVASDTALASIKKQYLKQKSLTFTAPTTGTYFLTIKSTGSALCAVADLAFVQDNTTQSITTTTTNLSFDNLNLTKTFIIGGANLTSDITLIAPSGITLSKTTVTAADALAGATITATYDNSTQIYNGIISCTSGTITKTISITGSNDITCLTQLYPGLTNIITDPYLNSLSTYGGWGTKTIVTDPAKAYCGLNCALVGSAAAKNTGSLDFYPAAGVMLSNTTYRLHAMVKTVGTGLSMQFGISGCGIGGVTTDFTSLVTTNGSWAPFDLTFTTGTLAASQDIYFNNSNATTPAFSGYIDNYELYAVPNVYTSASALTFLGVGSKKVAVRGVSLTNNITITAPAGYTVSPSTLLSTVSGDSVTVSFNSATSASGYIYFTSGTVKDSIQVTATVAPSIIVGTASLAFDELNPTGSFTVNGGNLLSDISIVAPRGITVNPTTIPAGSATGVTVTVTYDGTTSNINGNIVLTSGAATATVAVTAGKNSDCFTPLYSSLTDLIPNPQMNDISGFAGWGTGTRSVVFGQAYCGAACVMFSTTTNAYPTGDDLDLTNIVWAANSTYRLHAWVKAVDGTFAFLANGTNPDVTISVPQSNNVWELIDQTFTTGASPTTGFFTFNNVDGASTGKIAYLDNYELYNITSTVVTNNDNLADNQNLKVYVKGDKIVAYFSLSEASNVEFSVYNVQGLLISNVKEAFVAGQNQILINANLPSGVYLVKMFNKGQSFTTKLIK